MAQPRRVMERKVGLEYLNTFTRLQNGVLLLLILHNFTTKENITTWQKSFF
jgi:hypothetical protein